MVARIAGGAIAGWLLGLTPLILVNALSLEGGAVDPSAAAFAGALALALGVALGGLSAGLIGGQRGGVWAGVIAGASFATSLIALMYWLREQGNLPNLVLEHPVRTMGALLFLGAIIAGLAVGVAAFLSWRAQTVEAGRQALSQPAHLASARRGAGPVTGPARGGPPQYDRRDVSSTRQVEGVWTPDPRRARPGSAPRPTPVRPASQGDTRYDDRQERWSDTPGRW
jgi:hypothetical protein